MYFITGTAYAGKFTTVRMLAERYGMLHCSENYHSAVSDIIATPELQPDISLINTLTDWKQFVTRTPEEYERWIYSRKHYDEYAGSGFFTMVREDNGQDTREAFCDTIARHFGLI